MSSTPKITVAASLEDCRPSPAERVAPDARETVTATAIDQAETAKILDILPSVDSRIPALPAEKQLLLARVLAAKGEPADPEALRRLLTPAPLTDLTFPAKNMDALCERVIQAAEQGKRIAIYCDYDVDGTTSAAQVVRFFRALGITVGEFVSDRLGQGYGARAETVQQIADAGYEVLLCLDQGSSSPEAMACAKSRNLETLVIDHHQLSRRDPNIDCLLNPEQEGCGFLDGALCASGLTHCFLRRLQQRWERAQSVELDQLLPLAALGTVCDVMSLRDETNRSIVFHGLNHYPSAPIVGLQELALKAGIAGCPTVADVGFKLGPMMNAASRIEHARILLELLTTDDRERAASLAGELWKLNETRKELVEQVLQAAETKLAAYDEIPAGIALGDPGWHPGVLGIVAQRLVDRYGRPVCLLGGRFDDQATASARGVEGFSVTEAFTGIGSRLIRGGGHAAAGGGKVHLANLDEFQAEWAAQALAQRGRAPSVREIKADVTLELPSLDFETVRALGCCAPCGHGFPPPVIGFRNLTVLSVSEVDGRHLKVELSDGQYVLPAFLRHRTAHPALMPGATIDAAGTLERNDYEGGASLRLQLAGAEMKSEPCTELNLCYKPHSQVIDVQTPSGLAAMVQELSSRRLLSVDTETVWDETCGQRLCLIQIYDPESLRTFLVDAVALQDLSPLAAILSNPAITKIEHFSSFEAQRFAEHGITQNGIEDTCTLARKLLPHLPNHKLQTVAAYLLKIDVSKIEQKSDWSQRPLTDEQRRYAVVDVEIAHMIYEALKAIEARRRVELPAVADLAQTMAVLDDIQCEIDDLHAGALRELIEDDAALDELRRFAVPLLERGCLEYNGPCGHIARGGIEKRFQTELFETEVRALPIADEAKAELLDGVRFAGIRECEGLLQTLIEAGAPITPDQAREALGNSRRELRARGEHRITLNGRVSETPPPRPTPPPAAPTSLAELLARAREVELRQAAAAEAHPRYLSLLVQKELLLDEARRRLESGEKYRPAKDERRGSIETPSAVRKISVAAFRKELCSRLPEEWGPEVQRRIGELHTEVESAVAQELLKRLPLQESAYSIVRRCRVPTGRRYSPEYYVNVADALSRA